MTSLRKSLLTLTIVMITMCYCIPSNTQKKSLVDKVGELVKSASSKISGTSVTSFAKTMASSVVEYYMSQVESGLSIAILNSMRRRFLVNPRLYLARGKTVGPPLLMIPPGAKDQSDAKLIYLEETPEGILCYECLTAKQPAKTKLICLYFQISKEVGNLYSFTTSDNLDIFEPASVGEVLKVLQPTSERTAMNLVSTPQDLQIVAITQMTTGDNARLFLEVKDNFPVVQSIVFKRELVSALAIGLAGGVASALATAAKKYLTKTHGTILTLENLSNEKVPFILYEPIWYQDPDLQVHNIIPWKVERGKSYDITLTAKTTFKKTVVFALSFKFTKKDVPSESLEKDLASRRLVLTIWFQPLKNYNAKKYAWYSISWLGSIKNEHVPDALRVLVGLIQENPDRPAAAIAKADTYKIFEPFGDPTKIATTLPRLYYIPIGKYQCYKFWSFPVSKSTQEFEELKLLTAMGNGIKNGMVVKMFGSTRVPNQSEYAGGTSIPFPVDYINSPEQNPPM